MPWQDRRRRLFEAVSRAKHTASSSKLFQNQNLHFLNWNIYYLGGDALKYEFAMKIHIDHDIGGF